MRVSRIGASAWTIVILAITLWPRQPAGGGWLEEALAWLHARGLPAWVTYDVIEIAANVVLFVPFGAFVAFALLGSQSRRATTGSLSERSESKGSNALPLLIPTTLGLALSLAIEFVQAEFLPARFATVSDLVANTSGAFLGAVLTVVMAMPRIQVR